jgi:hypothetical protein
MADRLAPYITDEGLRSAHGRFSRERVEREFSLEDMVRRYTEVYDGLVRANG